MTTQPRYFTFGGTMLKKSLIVTAILAVVGTIAKLFLSHKNDG